MASQIEVLGQVARRAAWAPLTVIVLHSVAGHYFGHEPYVDPVMHFMGGVAAAYFMLNSASLAQTVLGVLTPLGRDMLAFGITGSAALMWEVGEFVGDQLRGTNVQRGLNNTMRDLILGVSGGVICIALKRAIPLVRASRGR